MTSLGPYASFIVTSYTLVAAVVVLLIVWIAIDHRQQKERLRELEASGVEVRSRLKISPATTSDAMPIRIVTIQPIGSLPGWSRRPRAPSIAPTMMSHIQCMSPLCPAGRARNLALLMCQGAGGCRAPGPQIGRRWT